MTFSRARLTGHRHGRGWDESELARRAGVRTAAVSDYEAGTRMPTPSMVSTLAAALDVAPDELDRAEALDYEDDYIAAVVQHLDPLSPEDVAAVSAILARSA